MLFRSRPPPVEAGEGLALALIKQHQEYEDDDRDALVQQYMSAAADWVENFTGKILDVGDIEQTVDCFRKFYSLYRGRFFQLQGLNISRLKASHRRSHGQKCFMAGFCPPKAGGPSTGEYTGGLKPLVDAFLASIDEESLEELEYATAIDRNNPTIAMAAGLVGLKDEQVDDLFRLAAVM